MSDLIQPIKDGKIATQTASNTSSSTSATSKKPSSSLDKDSFLKLLCTQMQYQDPLNPSSNTEYVAQLATFSELEQMKNLATTSTNSQALSLVGKNVTVTSDDSKSTNKLVNGTVDFVTISKGNVKLSINGNLYSVDQLASVTDETYLKAQNSPGVASKTTLSYNADQPKNVSFDVNMGSGNYVAENVAVVLNGTAINSSLVNVSKGKVTIDQSAFEKLQNGTYKLTIAFDNKDYTTVSDKVTLEVKNSKVINPPTTVDSSNNSNSKDAVTA